MGKSAKLARVQQLFAIGEVITIDDGEGGLLPIWVAKPTTFERDEAARDGRGQRALAMLAFDGDESAQAEVTLMMGEVSKDHLVGEIVREGLTKRYFQARDEVQADPEWTERLQALDAGGLEQRTPEMQAAFDMVTVDFEKAVNRIAGQAERELLEELGSLPRTEVEKRYRALYRESVGMQAFNERKRERELYLAIRDCSATRDDEGAWVHKDCGAHRTLLLDGIEGVTNGDLPDAVRAEAVEVLNRLVVSQEQAGKSAAPSVSSGPLEQPKPAEDSTLSTPSAM